MAQEFESVALACEAFVRSLEEGRYYDAHEDLEHLWFPRRFEDNDEIKLWKGFINAAVSFELIKRGRLAPSQKAWDTYLKYLPLAHTLESPHKELYGKIAQLLEQQRGVLCPSS